MGQSAPALCVDCGGEFLKAGAITCPQPMISAPRNGTRILLFYKTRGYSPPVSVGKRATKTAGYKVTGEKWEECRWINDKKTTGSDPHWEPWTGNYETRTTLHIKDKDALVWMPLP